MPATELAGGSVPLSDHKGVGGDVWEARAMFGPGYRLYFGKDGDSIIVLLVGADKGSQAKDIARSGQKRSGRSIFSGA